jgi:phenylalanyl-tRNA synthetase beta chain
MMCSERELELGTGHDGIIELPGDAPVGQSFATFAGLEDPVFDIAVTPNRPDCFGVRGIARDLAAAGLGTLREGPVRPFAQEGANPVAIAIEEGSGCEAFAGRLIRGVRNGPSPDWLQRRLRAVGLRPISALVDVTNFFSVDQARPLHVYDAALLKGGIVVRRGREGERFDALNDRSYEAHTDDCVIADDNGVLGLGGVVGGVSTGVTEDTTNVLLECAWFDPQAITRTGQRHQVHTDARARFERGVDPLTLEQMLDAATAMIVELCGGTPTEGSLATGPGWNEVTIPRTVALRPERVASLAGLDLPASEQARILTALGFEQGPTGWTVPGWRPDIDGEADLVEEVARVAGLDLIPSVPLPREAGVARPVALPAQRLERWLRRAAAARGFNEAITWSFIPEADAALFGGGAHVLANPISEEMKVMRPSLLPGLARAAARNLARGATSVRLFELGRRYLADAERPTLSLLLAGEATARGWQSGKARGFDPFDVKAAVVALLDEAGAPVANLQLAQGAGEAFHPGRSATFRLGKAELARFGELHPALAKALELPSGTQAADLYLDALPAARDKGRARPAFTPPALQPVTRDFAFVVPEELASGDLVRAVRGADKALIANVRLFDRFQPNGGDLSLALEVTLQPTDRTLTEEDLVALSAKVVASAAKLGARLRS